MHRSRSTRRGRERGRGRAGRAHRGESGVPGRFGRVNAVVRRNRADWPVALAAALLLLCATTLVTAAAVYGDAVALGSLRRAIVRSEGVTAIVATRDPVMLDVADHVVELRDGRILGSGSSAG